jgi:signal transduction histidine kinase
MSLRWLVIPVGIILGLMAETGWPAGIDGRLVVADLAVGWLLIGGGFAVWRARPVNRMGVLLMATGAAWFVATFYPPAAFLYCGPLVHALTAHPSGRVAGRPSRIVLAVAYIATASTVLIPVVWTGLAMAALIVVVGASRLVETGRHAGASWLAFALATITGLVLAGASAAHLRGLAIDDTILLAYEAVLGATVLSIVVDIVWWTSSPSVLARFVLDLGSAADAGTLRDRLAKAVGDPSLTIGYAVDGGVNAWVDDTGRPLVRPAETPDRSVTPIAAGGRELGFVAHDPAFIGDARVFGLIAAAAGLAISNTATQAEIRRQVAKVDASRERLVHAVDAQGRRLESALETGVDARLGRVAELLESASEASPDDAQLGTVIVELAAARRRLRDFSRGVYPTALRSGGLVTAIADLAERSAIPVKTMRIAVARYEPTVESTLYFVCSEALANVAKHAQAAHVTIELDDETTGPVLRIEDDGVGGARLAAGSGLRGLADRLDALGGSLVINDRPRGGTSVTAAVPRSRAAAHLAQASG